tara:strand:+ start:22 stop:234 length:213 start_codon:yes stop_codon:yes gene_type:complete
MQFFLFFFERMEMDVEQQQLYLTKTLRDTLKTAAKSQRRSVSSLAEELLKEALAKREAPTTLEKMVKGIR